MTRAIMPVPKSHVMKTASASVTFLIADTNVLNAYGHAYKNKNRNETSRRII